MKSPSYSKINQILASHPEDVRLLEEAGILNSENVWEVRTQRVIASLADKYYDLSKIKTEVLEEIGSYELKDLEFEPGRYEYAYDYLGNLETACRTMGLTELEIEETDDGYKLGEQEAGSIDELENAEARLSEYSSNVARDLTDKVGLPGIFYFGFSSDFGDDAYRLFYAFEDSDIPALQKLSPDIDWQTAPVEPGTQPQLEASFEEILATLEQEGCHEIALRLHSILREN